jgi:hypothetical protein
MATKPRALVGAQVNAIGAEQHAPINVEDIDLRDYSRIDAPIINASIANIQTTGHEYLLMLARARPMQDNSGKGIAPFATQEIVAIVSLSPQFLKDLSIILEGQVKTYEQQFGEIKTPLSLTRGANILQAAPRGRRTKGH